MNATQGLKLGSDVSPRDSEPELALKELGIRRKKQTRTPAGAPQRTDTSKARLGLPLAGCEVEASCFGELWGPDAVR